MSITVYHSYNLKFTSVYNYAYYRLHYAIMIARLKQTQGYFHNNSSTNINIDNEVKCLSF